MKKALIFSFLFGLATSVSQASYQVTDQDLSELKGFCKALTVSYSPEELKKAGITSGLSYAEDYTFVATSGVEFQFKIQDFHPLEPHITPLQAVHDLQSAEDFVVDRVKSLKEIIAPKHIKVTETYKRYELDDFKAPLNIRKVWGEVRPHLLEKYSYPFLVALTHPDLRPQIKDDLKLHVNVVHPNEEFIGGLLDAGNLSTVPLVTRFLKATTAAEVYGLFARYKNPYHPKFGQETLLLKFMPEQDM